MKKTNKLVDKTYRLKGNKQPVTVMLNSKNTRRNPLLWFDEDKGYNRALRYASNQRSPFEDEQDGHVILEHIIFERGMLFVQKEKQSLQNFLSYHPSNGSLFEEVDNERDAQAEVEILDLEFEAMAAARDLPIDVMETIVRIDLGEDPTKMSSAELKRDIKLYARNYPQDFMDSINDPLLQLQSKASQYFQDRLVVLRNHGRDIYFNLPKNKKKLKTIPQGENHIHNLAEFLKTDEGIETTKLLDKALE